MKNGDLLNYIFIEEKRFHLYVHISVYTKISRCSAWSSIARCLFDLSYVSVESNYDILYKQRKQCLCLNTTNKRPNDEKTRKHVLGDSHVMKTVGE